LCCKDSRVKRENEFCILNLKSLCTKPNPDWKCAEGVPGASIATGMSGSGTLKSWKGSCFVWDVKKFLVVLVFVA
jgi:hypothetical protein